MLVKCSSKYLCSTSGLYRGSISCGFRCSKYVQKLSEYLERCYDPQEAVLHCFSRLKCNKF